MNPEFYSHLAEPLEGAEKTGTDASHSDEYTAVDLQIEKNQGLSFASADWKVVEDNAVIVLSEQSKDLRIASYLTVALYEQHGFLGLSAGLQLLVNMLKADYWPTIFPNRKRKPNKARASAFVYLYSHLEKAFSTFGLDKDSDFEHVVVCCELFQQLQSNLKAHLDDDAPSNEAVKKRFGEFHREAKSWQEQFKKDQAEKEKNKPSVVELAKQKIKLVKEAIVPVKDEPDVEGITIDAVESEPVAQPSPTPVEIPQPKVLDTVSKDNMDKALGACRENLLAVAKALRASDPMDARAFYLVRTAQWLVVDEVPGNNVMPPNPSEQQIQDLKVMADNQQYVELVEQAENLFEQGAIFSGALHRIIANALLAVGHDAAAFMIKSCLQQFQQRLPALTINQFNNGETFIDALTVAWLGEGETSTGKTVLGSSQTGGTDVTNSNTPWHDAGQQAMSLLAKGQFDQGIAIFTQGIALAPGLRERTYWQLAQAQFCEKAGHIDLALSQLQALEQFVGDGLLSEWEPQLRVEIVTELLQCHVKKMAQTTYSTEQQQALAPLYSELSLKAPVVALSITIN